MGPGTGLSCATARPRFLEHESRDGRRRASLPIRFGCEAIRILENPERLGAAEDKSAAVEHLARFRRAFAQHDDVGHFSEDDDVKNARMASMSSAIDEQVREEADDAGRQPQDFCDRSHRAAERAFREKLVVRKVTRKRQADEADDKD